MGSNIALGEKDNAKIILPPKVKRKKPKHVFYIIN